ncbi:uncharacterized protein ZC3H3 [Panulirus ornatus]|uniref:uncharacterized protein ZC3H3 n=1 Tax=Panulirus ornatus TaxID=150431 RepID=UPI003A861F4A
MDYKKEQKNIHVNPDFIARRGQTKVKSKVHVNPAFLHKSQTAHLEGKIVKDADPLTGQSSSQPLQDFHISKINQGKQKDKFQRSNAQHTIVRESSACMSQLREASCHVYTVDDMRSDISSVSDTDYQKYVKTNVKSQTMRVRPTHYFGTSYSKSKVTQPSAYSWTAAGAKVQTFSKGISFSGHDQKFTHTVFSSSSSPKKFPHQDLFSRNRLVKYNIQSPVPDTIHTENKFKINNIKKADSLKYNENSLHNVTMNQTYNTQNPGKFVHDLYLTGVINANKNVSQEIHGSKSSVAPAAVNKAHPQGGGREYTDMYVETESFPHTSRGSNILINPRLLKHLSCSNHDLRSKVSSELQSILPPSCRVSSTDQTTLLSVHSKSNVAKATADAHKKNGKYKIISKTKLVRRRSGSYTSNGTGKEVTKKTVSEGTSLKLPQNSTRVPNLSRPSLKFPARNRRYSVSTKINFKKRYSVLSRTKLIRHFSSPSGTSGDGLSGKPKYSVKTKTKLIRRQHGSGNNDCKSFPKAEELKAKVIKSDTDRKKKFSVLSKTKLIRRRSNSGGYKTVALNNPVKISSSDPGVRTIVRRHKLVRNVPMSSENYRTQKVSGDLRMRNIHSTYHIVKGGVKLSAKQKAAKGIISKYKINRLKLESTEILKKRKSGYIPKPERKHKFSLLARKEGTTRRSDRIINIGGILYKSTKTSLRKQLSKNTQDSKRPSDSRCIVWLRGDQFLLSARGRTLKRIRDGSDSLPSKHSLSRVHIGGLTYSRTKAGQYELTKIHQTRAVLSSAKHRSLLTLAQRRKKGTLQKRNENCIFFNRFGRCTKKDRGECPYLHDPKRVAVCTRFLRGRCPVNNCPFSHIVDPDKMPVCSHFVQASCTRDGCPYRHVRVNPSAPICLGFLKGHCHAGEECKKQHILVCEEFSTTGKCPRGVSCPLSHHKGQTKYRKSVTLEPAEGETKKIYSFQYRKRKKSESRDVLGGSKVKKRIESKSKGITDKVVQQRYFQVMKLENNDTEELGKVSEVNKVDMTETKSEKNEIMLLDNRSSEGTSVMDHSSSSSAISLQEKLKTEMQGARKEDEIQEGLAHNSSRNNSDLDRKRQRILQRVDKMKSSCKTHKVVGIQNYALNSESNDTQEKVSMYNELNQPRIVGQGEVQDPLADVDIQNNRKGREECEIDFHNNEPCRSRRPLLQRLPSYIPLSLNEDVVDL